MHILLVALLAKSVLVLPDLTVSPQGLGAVNNETTLEELAEIFGEENLETVSIHLGEGFYSQGTSVYPGTSIEFQVIWEDNTVSEIKVLGADLKTEDEIGLGSTLTDLDAVIGEFQMAGFAWDAEGYAVLEGTDYEGLYIRLVPETAVPESFMGDALFSSEELRDINPIIVDLRVVY